MCRNSDDFVRPQSVTIAPLVAKGGVETSPRLWEMEAYATGQNQHMYVNFLDAISVPILALDLTVFSNNGKSIFLADSQCPASVVPSWRKRHEQVLGEVNDIVKRYKKALSQVAAVAETEPAALVDPVANGADQETLENDVDADKLLCQALTNSVPDVFLGAIDAENSKVYYNIERVSRLKPPYASALLRAYAAYLARDGFDHDLTRTNQSPRVLNTRSSLIYERMQPLRLIVRKLMTLTINALCLNNSILEHLNFARKGWHVVEDAINEAGQQYNTALLKITIDKPGQGS